MRRAENFVILRRKKIEVKGTIIHILLFKIDRRTPLAFAPEGKVNLAI